MLDEKRVERRRRQLVHVGAARRLRPVGAGAGRRRRRRRRAERVGEERDEVGRLASET